MFHLWHLFHFPLQSSNCILMVVLLNRVRIIQYSSSSKNVLGSFINFCLFNAEDISIPVMCTKS